jgi:hypothetical protein
MAPLDAESIRSSTTFALDQGGSPVLAQYLPRHLDV